MRKMRLSLLSHKREYECQYPWPEDCPIQGGDSGIVLPKGSLEKALTDPKESLKVVAAALGQPSTQECYRTAFVEAFPRNPDTFIRGEGSTLEEAETDAWDQFLKVNRCSEHEYERKGYTNGAGFCKHCGMFKSKAFEPTTKCCKCGSPTNYSADRVGNFYCNKDYSSNPNKREF